MYMTDTCMVEDKKTLLGGGVRVAVRIVIPAILNKWLLPVSTMFTFPFVPPPGFV